MADAKKCDKCRKYMDVVASRVEITLEYKFQGDKEPKHCDLCLDCQIKFYDFLNEVEE